MKGKKGERGRRRERGRHKTEREIREKAVSGEDVPVPKKLDCDQILWNILTQNWQGTRTLIYLFITALVY